MLVIAKKDIRYGKYRKHEGQRFNVRCLTDLGYLLKNGLIKIPNNVSSDKRKDNRGGRR